MIRRIQLVTLAAVLLSLALPLAQSPGQNRSKPSPTESQTTLQATTELVLVPVVVTDGSGKPVTGLRRNDFVIYADGKPQRIAGLDEIRVPQSSAKEQLAPDWYSNYVTDAGSSPRPLILVIDFLNSAATDQRQARDQILRFLDTELQPNQPVAAFFLSDKGLQLLQSFTSGSAQLKAAVLALQEGTTYKDQNDNERELLVATASTLPTSLPSRETTKSRYRRCCAKAI